MRILCLTCDQYSYIVPFFVQFLKKKWPACPWPVRIITDTKPIPDVTEQVLMMRSGRHFSNRLISYMDIHGFEDEHILVMLEDYIIRTVDHRVVTKAYQWMREDSNIGMIRLYPKPGPTKPCGEDPDIGEIDRADLYVASLQASMWRSEIFRAILGPAEDPWVTEEAGSWRARHMPENVRFLCTYKEAIDYHNYCSKGVLDVEVTKWIQANQ